jgi:hypothetical protein
VAELTIKSRNWKTDSIQVCLRTSPWYSRRLQGHAYIPYDVTNIHDLTDMDVPRQYVYTFLCVFVSRIRYAANY